MLTKLFRFALTVFSLSSFLASGQIQGNSSCTTGNSYTYSYNSSSYLPGPTWNPSGGYVSSSWSDGGYSGSTYYATIVWTSTGTHSLTFANYSELIATLSPIYVCSSGQAALVSLLGPSAICLGATVQYTATPTNGGTSPSYIWKVNGVTKQSGSSASYSTNQLALNDVVSVTLTSSIVCLSNTSATASKTISSATTPTAVSVSINNPGTVCQGTSITFTATPTNGGTSPTYEWYRNGYWAEGNIYSPTGNQYSPDGSHPFQNGETMQVKITSNSTCYTGSLVQSSNIITISIQANITPSVSIYGANNMCEGSSQTYTAGSPQTITSYSWAYNAGDAGLRTGTNSSFPLSGADLQSPSSSVQLTVGVSGTCLTSNTASTTLPLTIDEAPQVGTLDADNTIFCGSGTVNLTLTSHFGNNSWKYRYKDGTNGTFNSFTQFSTSSSNSATYSSLTCGSSLPRIYEFKTFVSNGSCTIAESNAKTITVYPQPSVGTLSATNGPNFCSSGTINLELSSYVGYLDWQYQEKDQGGTWSQWISFSSASSTSNSFPVSNNGNVPREFRFKVTALHGTCLGTETPFPYVTSTSVPIPGAPSSSVSSTTDPGYVTLYGGEIPNSTTTRWYNTSSGGTPVAISDNYSPYLYVTTSFWGAAFNETVPCEGARTEFVAHVFPAPPVVTPTSGEVNMGMPVTLSVTNGPYATYTWWRDGNIVGTNATIDASIPGSYRVEGTKTGMSESRFSPYIILKRAFDDQSPKHYVIVNHIKTKNITDPTQVEGLPIEGRSRTVNYIGGLGNTLQMISSSSSPMKKDVVQTPKYDVLGRQLVQYMPYVSSTNDSKFRSHALDSMGYTNSEQYTFYQQTGLARASDTKPFSTTEVEPSPLQRPLAQTGAGEAWYTAAKKVLSDYLLNRATDNIRIWKVVSGLPTSSAAYADYELYVHETTDENGNKVKTYTDKVGHVVQKNVQSTPSTWLKTCYVYDDLGRIAFVLTPEGIRTLSGYSPTQPFLDSWAFQYGYDSFGRVVETKPPGAGWQYTIYDKLDRVTMSQSAEQRTRNEWTFMKYDIYGRAVIIGYKVISGDRTTMQTNVDGQLYNYENISTDAIGYTLNRTYPSASASDLLSVSYYDNYDFLSYSGWDAEAHSFSFSSELGIIETSQLLTGYPTGGKLRVVDSSTPSSLWLNTVQYYDADGRPVQIIAENHLGGLDRTTTLYDFEGKVLKTKSTHSANQIASVVTQRRNGYDHAARLTNAYHRIGEPVKWSNAVNAVVNGATLTKTSGGGTWDAGAFSENMIFAGQDGWVEFTVPNTTTFRMVGLSDQDNGVDPNSIDYALFIYADGGLVFVYEGGENRGYFGTYTASDVFQIERKDGTIHYKKNDVIFYSSSTPSSGVLHVDASLYSNGLSVLNASIGLGTSEVQVTALEYNELGQLIDKKLHSTNEGSTFLQSVDHRYNIRGWLSSINNAELNSDTGITNDDTDDYFGMDLLYNTTESGLGNTANYKGNLSALKWKGIGSVPGSNDRQSYKYTYDKTDRLLTATSQMSIESTWTKEADAKNENITYDENGNIKTLQRNHRKHQLSGIVPSYTSEPIDNLTYTYKTSNGNQLDKVEDSTGKNEGFANGSSANGEIIYNTDGSISADNNKGVSTIHYNMLGKPWQILFTDGRKLEYTYGASGEKLNMRFYQGTTVKKAIDYVSGFVHEDGMLQFFASPEGRVTMKSEDRVAWEFTSDIQGWHTLYQVSNFAWNSSGYAEGTITGTDPHIASPSISVPIDQNTVVKIRMKVNSTTFGAQLFFTTTAQGSFNEPMSKHFTLVAQNDVFNEYTLDLSNNSAWNGTLTQLRIDPIQTGGGNSFAIDYVKVIKRTPEYEYAITDHQGNTRILFTSAIPSGESANTNFESNPGNIENFPTGGNLSTLPLFNNTPSGTKSQLLNGGYNGQVGIGKSFLVFPGDTVRISAYAKYEGTNSNTPGSFASALLAAFGLPAPSSGETGTASAALNTWGSLVDGGYVQESYASAPMAHVNIVIFDKNYNFLDAAYTQISAAAEQIGATPDVDHEYLLREYIVEQQGFVFMYVSNNSPVNVYFDDVHFRHSETNVIQYNEYYPFGLQTSNSWTREDASNRYLYNGGNELNENSGWYETFFREYDAALGRFLQVDPLAGLFASSSPYLYAHNNPLLYNDVLGDSSERFGPASGKHWSDGAKYSDWSANGGSQMYRDGLAAGAVDIGGILYDISEGYRTPYSEHNGQLGIWYHSYTDWYVNGEFVDSYYTHTYFKPIAVRDLWGKGSVPYTGSALAGTNFIGPGPDVDPRSLGMKPIDEMDLGAFFHDIVYFQKGTGGVQGALLNLQVKEADLALALAARSIIERYGTKNNKDAVTNLPISERTRNLAIAVWNVFAPITEMKYQREGHIFPPGGLHNPPATPPAPIFISLAFLPLIAP